MRRNPMATSKSELYEGSAASLLDSEHGDIMPGAVLVGWKCDYKPKSESVMVYENEKDMAYAVRRMEMAGYEVTKIDFESGYVEFHL